MSGTVEVKTPTKEAFINAVVTRADGTVEDLGTISYYHKNPLKRWWWHLRKAVGLKKEIRNYEL